MTPREYWREATRLAIESIREGTLPREVLSYYWTQYRKSRKSLQRKLEEKWERDMMFCDEWSLHPAAFNKLEPKE